MTRYTLYRGLGKIQGRCWRVRKSCLSPEFDPRTVQPLASHYTDWAIPDHTHRSPLNISWRRVRHTYCSNCSAVLPVTTSTRNNGRSTVLMASASIWWHGVTFNVSISSTRRRILRFRIWCRVARKICTVVSDQPTASMFRPWRLHVFTYRNIADFTPKSWKP
jgi:hypothetical protein